MGRKYWWPAVLGVALFSYGYLLDGLHTPKVGDEYLYLQVSRVTAEQGAWLPLVSEEGINNRKPPLLFWVGMLATNWNENLELLRFRIPVLVYTLLTAWLAALFATRIAGERGMPPAERRTSGWIGALSFLAFFSSFKYGRNFLTNMPEAFFTFLAVYLVAALPVRDAGVRGWLSWAAVGAAVGGVLLHRSVVLIAPIFLVLGLHLLLVRGRDLRGFLVRDVPRLSLALAVSVACFGLWFALDPRPEEIVRIFFLDENLGKMNQGGYLKGLFAGNYNLSRIWTGHLINAGMFAVPVIALAILGWRHRRSVGPLERLLWLLVLAYIAVFTFPHQRSPSYLISGTPALGALLGVYWMRFSPRAFRVSAVPFAAVYAFAVYFAWRIEARGIFDIGFAWFHWPMLALGLGLTAAILARPAEGRWLLHLNAFVFLIVLSGSIRPLETRDGRFGGPGVERIESRGAVVMVPSGFRARYERYRFLLPGARIKGYDARASREQIQSMLDRELPVIVALRPGQSSKELYPGAVEISRRWDLRTRHDGEELKRIILGGELDLLFQQEVILSRAPRIPAGA